MREDSHKNAKKIQKSRLVLLDIKAYYKAITIKNLVLALQTDQWQRTEIRSTDLNIYVNLVHFESVGKDEFSK